MRPLISRLFGRRRHQMAYGEMQQVMGNIPTYAPNQKTTAVLIVQTRHLDSFPISAIAVHNTSLSGIKLVEVEVRS